MDNKLIKQLIEADLFGPPSETEVKQREKDRPPFVCPECGGKLRNVVLTQEAPSVTVPISSSGKIDSNNFYAQMLEQPGFIIKCTECNKDISEYIMLD